MVYDGSSASSLLEFLWIFATLKFYISGTTKGKKVNDPHFLSKDILFHVNLKWKVVNVFEILT